RLILRLPLTQTRFFLRNRVVILQKPPKRMRWTQVHSQTFTS
ncbi:bacterial extracellular solute-binding family protein, partial [Vibrio parahaemolyticus V-223/04]